jgi:hypothetical protein
MILITMVNGVYKPTYKEPREKATKRGREGQDGYEMI